MAKPPVKEELPHPATWVTRKVTLTDVNEWIDVGAGPLMLMSYHAIVFAIGDAKPDLAPNEGFRLLPGESQTVSFGAHVWVSGIRTGAETDIYVAREE